MTEKKNQKNNKKLTRAIMDYSKIKLVGYRGLNFNVCGLFPHFSSRMSHPAAALAT